MRNLFSRRRALLTLVALPFAGAAAPERAAAAVVVPGVDVGADRLQTWVDPRRDLSVSFESWCSAKTFVVTDSQLG